MRAVDFASSDEAKPPDSSALLSTDQVYRFIVLYDQLLEGVAYDDIESNILFNCIPMSKI